MSFNGIDPNDLFFDTNCYGDFSTVMNVAKGVQFNPVVNIINGGTMPLEGEHGFWDTAQYENENIAIGETENSFGSLSLNDIGNENDESMNSAELDRQPRNDDADVDVQPDIANHNYQAHDISSFSSRNGQQHNIHSAQMTAR